jgi:DNA-binding response OmpR family regulator
MSLKYGILGPLAERPLHVHLQGMDGIEASRRLRAERSGVVVLLLSTSAPVEFGSRLLSSGASSFIPKADFGPRRLTACAGGIAAG